MNHTTLINFGGNQSFTPKSIFAPKNEGELLEILRQCRGRRIRAIGRLHSWSEAPVADDVLIDLRHFNDVRTEARDGRTWVVAGAGCQIKKLLRDLNCEQAGTLPTLGLITEQAIAGAISSGTHGSGRPSMSHFMQEVRIAAYNPTTGEPEIRAISGGDELRAARCSLGAMGLIVSVGFWSRPAYRIQESFRQYENLNEVVAAEDEFPLQQFFLMPWLWEFIAQHRRETDEPRGGWATLYRIYFFLQFDVGLHLITRFAARVLKSPRLVRFMFRKLTPRLVVKNWHVVDDANKMLVMEHELFQHIEIEIFVCRAHLAEATDCVVQLLKHFDGDAAAIDGKTRAALIELGLEQEIEHHCGKYTHHYPICYRRVLPDDTLISPTAGAEEPWYAMSFISYALRSDRAGFNAFARVTSRVLAARFGARPHWGKVYPLSAAEVVQLYPNMPKFRAECERFDSTGQFRNPWVDRVVFASEETTTTKPTSLPS